MLFSGFSYTGGGAFPLAFLLHNFTPPAQKKKAGEPNKQPKQARPGCVLCTF